MSSGMVVSTKIFMNLLQNFILIYRITITLFQSSQKKFDSVKRISEFILKNRTKYSIADAHNHPEGSLFLELCASSKTNSKRDSIYIVSQRDVLSHFYQFWVPNEREIMKLLLMTNYNLWEFSCLIRFGTTSLT